MMFVVANLLPLLVLALSEGNVSAYNVVQRSTTTLVDTTSATTTTPTMNRRDVGRWIGSATFGILTSASLESTITAAHAFDGSGSTAYSGKGPATKAALRKSYQERIAADVRDFNILGAAINNGETEGKAWVNFFIPLQRREADTVGRTYAALADLRGIAVNKKKTEFEGGDGLLLANTFTKAGKPPDNTPAVKSFNKLYPAFDPIELAGKNGDVTKAKMEWKKASMLLSQYLTDVEMPGSLDDPLYQ